MLSRREFVQSSCGLLGALPFPALSQTKLGIAQFSYHLRLAHERSQGVTGLSDPLKFLDHCHQLGAGGVQLPLGRRDAAYLADLRKRAERYEMFLEGQVRLPADPRDAERFESEVKTAKEAGVSVLRTVMLGGRRYEQFDSAEAFRAWADKAIQSVRLAAPIVARHGLTLAIENHKDWRAEDLVALLKKLGSDHLGVCVDTGNNIALLEDPMEATETLAPWAVSVHIKDMAVAEHEDGFLLSEVPLGKGFLDLKRIVTLLTAARPAIRFNLEMITRDPLKIPCLTPKYWATFPDLPGKHLARTLAMVRKHRSPQPLPRAGDLAKERQLALEEENVRHCLAYTRDNLKL